MNIIEGNILKIDGCAIEFKYDIREFVTIGAYTTVRLAITIRDDYTNNIYGVKDGKIVWRVQDMLEYDENYAPFAPDPYAGIRVYNRDESLIIATTGYGFRVLIDPITGKIVGKESWVK